MSRSPGASLRCEDLLLVHALQRSSATFNGAGTRLSTKRMASHVNSSLCFFHLTPLVSCKPNNSISACVYWCEELLLATEATIRGWGYRRVLTWSFVD